MDKLKKALGDIKRGRFVLVHDSDSRENEIDFVIAAEYIKSGDIATMRRDGGGLICVSIDNRIANELGLPFMADLNEIASVRYPVLGKLYADDIPYDEKSSFSITINHRKTFTGITDEDRALTIKEFARLCENPDQDIFGGNFRSPGHVHLLISTGIENRGGHTELSVALLKLADITPVAAICEMMDAESKQATSEKKAGRYAEEHDIVLLEAKEIIKAAGVR